MHVSSKTNIIVNYAPFHNLSPFLCSTLPVGRVNFTCDQIVENIISATEQVASKVGSDNIQSIHVKMPDSIALPVLNCLPPGPTVIDTTSQPSKRKRLENDEPLSGIDMSGEIEEILPAEKKVKKTPITKLSTKRVRGSIVVKKQLTRRKKKR